MFSRLGWFLHRAEHTMGHAGMPAVLLEQLSHTTLVLGLNLLGGRFIPDGRDSLKHTVVVVDELLQQCCLLILHDLGSSFAHRIFNFLDALVVSIFDLLSDDFVALVIEPRIVPRLTLLGMLSSFSIKLEVVAKGRRLSRHLAFGF